MPDPRSWDYIIVGSGFGGSVCAMRPAQKGYRVCVIEKGKRLRSHDFPKSNWNLRKYFWAPALRCFGLQQITLLKGLLLLHGCGVGGGSLVYANTLMRPPPDVFTNPEWPKSVSWEQELSAFYQLAQLMLGVVPNPYLNAGEMALKDLGKKLGCEHTFHRTELGVYFGTPEKSVPDPYFAGQGPERSGCNECGGCMVGCRYNAKNTLDKNYLFFAEKWGAEILPELTVTDIRKTGDQFFVQTQSSTRLWFKKGPTLQGKNVILSAGVLGTVDLLLQCADQLGVTSKSLGRDVRTNGESLLGATSFKNEDLARGVAIGAAIHPNAVTKIENVRYPSGSNAMRLLAVPLTGPGNFIVRPFKMVLNMILRWPRLMRLLTIKDWAASSIILLFMQNIDQKMVLLRKRNIFGRRRLSSKPTAKPVPTYNKLAQKSVQHLAEIIEGEPQNVFSEVVFNTPATAHILGGCAIADSPEEGVINTRHEVFGVSGLYVCDGSVVPSNLGVNPSLTITALAERFMSLVPNKPGVDEQQLKKYAVQFSDSHPGQVKEIGK